MCEAESVSTALSAFLTRFPNLPPVPFYDNACNLASVALRFPWMFDSTTFLCERFHYRSHSCSSLFDPDTYPMCDDLLTFGAEALNRKLTASRNHIRYLAGRKLVPFLYVRALFLNLHSHMRDSKNYSGVEDLYMSQMADKFMPCLCTRCTAIVRDDNDVIQK